MERKRLYLEDGKLFYSDSKGKVKKLNSSYKVHRVLNDIITNGYKIVFSGNNMILKGNNRELELVDYINLLDHRYLAFLDFDILKNTASNFKSKVRSKNQKKIYLENNKIMFSDNLGRTSELDSSKEIHRALDRIIIDGYKLAFDGDNIILVGRDCQLVIEDYGNVLDREELHYLNYDILKKIANNDLLEIDRNNRKKIYLSSFRNVACFSLAVTVLFNVFHNNVFGVSKTKSMAKENNNTPTSEYSDEFSLLDDSIAIKNGEFPYENLEELKSFYKRPGFLTDSFNNGIQIIGAIDNSVIENDEQNKKEEVFNDEEIEMVCEFINYNHLTIDSFASLIELMTSEEGPFGVLYPSSVEAIKALIQEELSYQVKFLVIMIREDNTYAELDKMCAGVCGEAFGDGNCYEDAYAVASSLINRTHKDSYVNKYGQRLYDQFCAPGQYEVDISGNYKKFLGQIDCEGYHAAIDAFYTRESMHSYIEFRANWVQLNNYEMFVPGGNKFIAKMKDSQYVPYPEEEIELDDVKVLVLENAN